MTALLDLQRGGGREGAASKYRSDRGRRRPDRSYGPYPYRPDGIRSIRSVLESPSIVVAAGEGGGGGSVREGERDAREEEEEGEEEDEEAVTTTTTITGTGTTTTTTAT